MATAPGTVGATALGTVGATAPGTVRITALGTVGTTALGTVGTTAPGTVGTTALGTVGTTALGTVGTTALGTVGTTALGTVRATALGTVRALGALTALGTLTPTRAELFVLVIGVGIGIGVGVLIPLAAVVTVLRDTATGVLGAAALAGDVVALGAGLLAVLGILAAASTVNCGLEATMAMALDSALERDTAISALFVPIVQAAAPGVEDKAIALAIVVVGLEAFSVDLLEVLVAVTIIALGRELGVHRALLVVVVVAVVTGSGEGNARDHQSGDERIELHYK
jgi:hypothetical protein